MIRRRLRESLDHGETLIELLVTITIMSIIVIAAGTGIALSIVVADTHQKGVKASYFLHNYAEAVQSATYTACASSPNYVTIAGLATPSGFKAPIQSAIKYWNGTSFAAACPSPDLGLEQVTLKLTSTDNRASESIVVVVRKP